VRCTQAATGITVIEASSLNGEFHCHFRRSIVVNVNDKIYSLDKTYHLMLATGGGTGNYAVDMMA
jgi:uncharacterized protein YxjI